MLLAEMPPPTERPGCLEGTLTNIVKLNYGQARMTGGKWTKVRHAEGDVISPSWAEHSKMNRYLLVVVETRAHCHGSYKGVDSVTTRSRPSRN